MTDLISKRTAIDALGECPELKVKLFGKSYEEGRSDQWFKDVGALIAVPSADIDLSGFYDKVWRLAYERGKEEAVIRCKDCKNSEPWYKDRRRCFLWSEAGVSVWDSGFCNYAERRTDDTD